MSKESPIQPPVHDWKESHGIEKANQRAFLSALAIVGNPTGAARVCGVSKQAHYVWLQESEAYKAASEVAIEEAGDLLELEARDRAMRGTCEAVWWQGKVVGHKWVKDTTLLIFLMKGAKPDKYKERIHTEHAGKMSLEDLIGGSMAKPEGKK